MSQARRSGVVLDGPHNGDPDLFRLVDDETGDRLFFRQWNPFFLPAGTFVTFEKDPLNPIVAIKVRDKSSVDAVSARAREGMSLKITPGGMASLEALIVDRLPPTAIDLDGESREASAALETIRELREFLRQAEQEGKTITYRSL